MGEAPCCPKCGRAMLITNSQVFPDQEFRIIHSGHCPKHVEVKMDIYIKEMKNDPPNLQKFIDYLENLPVDREALLMARNVCIELVNLRTRVKELEDAKWTRN